MIVKRPTATAGTAQLIEFNNKMYCLKVKNLDIGEVRVTLGREYDENNYISIPAATTEYCYINMRKTVDARFDKVGLWTENKITTEVELQCIEY